MHQRFKFAFVMAALATLAACGDPTLLTVHANATTRATPDLAIVTLGVSARGESARAAQAAQATRMAAVMEAARAAGAEEADVQTIGLSIDPIYAYPRNQAPRVTGYMSRNTVTVRVKNLDAVSTLIDATVAQGANELHGIQFAFQNEEASLDAARAEALQTARTRANAYAEAGGMRVVRMLSITEPGAVAGPIAYDGSWARASRNLYAAEAQAANVAPINPGQLDAQSGVTVVFELR